MTIILSKISWILIIAMLNKTIKEISGSIKKIDAKSAIVATEILRAIKNKETDIVLKKNEKYSGLCVCMNLYPELFRGMRQKYKNFIITIGKEEDKDLDKYYRKQAERLARNNKKNPGAIPGAKWLMENNKSGLLCYIKLYPEVSADQC